MRFLRLFLGDTRFQVRYGFYLLYALLTLVYLLLLSLVPVESKAVVAAILIFSDPAAMGLFFMGAIVLLEKSQHVQASLAVSPVKLWEYILSKGISLSVIGCIVSLVLACMAGMSDLFLLFVGVFSSSMLFSFCGLFTAMRTDTLNGFMLASVPFEILIFIPAMLNLFGVVRSPWTLLHPGVAAIALIGGLDDMGLKLLCILSLAIWNVLAFLLCHRAVGKGFARIWGEGGKL